MSSKRKCFIVLALALASVFVLGGNHITFAQSGTSIFINEIHYDNDGADAGEAVEIAGPAGTDLAGWSVALYNGSATQLNVYDTIALAGVIADQQGGYGTLYFAAVGMQNGAPDGLALVNPANTVIQFLSYEGSFTAASGPAAGMTSVDIGVAEASTAPLGDSLQLTGSGTTYEDFAWASSQPNTFGAVNSGQSFGAAGDMAPAVSSISPGDNATNVAVDANIDVVFSEDVAVAGSWVEVSCTVSGMVATAVTGGPQSFTLDPITNFANDESCTVTVFAAQVVDLDAIDPPDNMDVDFVSSFSTVAEVVATPEVIINEIDYDQPGTDVAEYVELKNIGADGVNLSEFTLELVNGTGGGASVYQTYALPAVTLAAGDYFVVCADAATVANCDMDVAPDSNLVQNGAPDAVGLRHLGTLVDAVSYEGDTGAPYTEGTGTGLEDPGTTGSDNLGISRFPDGVDTDQNNVDLSQRCITPGAANTEASTGCPLPQIGDLVINEIDYDQDGTDAAEFVEIYNASNAILNLSTYELQLVNGSNASVYSSTPLPDFNLNSGQYYVVCGDAANVPNCDLDITPDTNLIQNGAPDAVALVENGVIIDTVSYEGDVAAPYTEGSGIGLEDLPGDGYSGIARFPDGKDTDQNNVDLNQYCATPGEANTNASLDCVPPVVEACGDPFTPIYTIQGSGLASLLDNNVVSTEGVVTATYFDTNEIGGFFIQDAVGDGDLATSDGIYVFTTFYTPAVGDKVRVTGTVDEYFNLTEITSVSNVLACGIGEAIAPTAVSLPFASSDALEAYEGMLVTLPQALTISEYFNFDRFGEIVLSTDRQFQPTAVYEPGSPEAAALAAANLLSRITLDDGRSNQNPDPARHPNGANFDLTNTFRGGDTVQNVTGVVDYAFGAYKIQPTVGADYVSRNPRAEAPEVGGSVKVASFNVLNYFTTLDDGVNDICGPLQNQECRGADDANELTRQRNKIIAALLDINADVFGLIEIENHITDAAVQDLVNGLNDAAGAGTYAYVETGTIGTDAIKLAIVYKPATVSLAGDYAILDSSVDGRFMDTRNRPALAQSFVENETNSVFTVVVNHLKSKGSGCGVGDDDPEQGNCNLTRTLAAQALVDWLATDPTASGDADYLIIGDLNSYDKEDPIDAILAGSDDTVGSADDYTDLSHLYGGEFAYSYVFDSQLGYLDYALATASLLPQITGVATWHINADEPDLLDYDTGFKQDAQDALYEPNAYRSSDHDPVIIGLDFGLPRNADGCFVIAAENTPFEGRAVTVDTHHHVLNGMVWLLQSDLPRQACLEIHGTDGQDILMGSRGDDDIFGYSGHDLLFGFHGDDVFTGGKGLDFFNGGPGQDSVLDYERFEHCTSIEEGCKPPR
ncbi:MAG: ExeM/NucH family extracellular endonuclease [Anaerolineae bacterium]|nr:ExeM/NucH family extracellular endonuclease [Anaerolineae bacterium]